MTSRAAKHSRLAVGALILAGAACSGSTDVALSIVQVRGQVTSTTDNQPIAGVGVVLTYPVTGGTGAFDRSTSETSWTGSDGRYVVSLTDIVCTPGTLDLGVALPAGYQFPADLAPASIECTEEIQVLDFQLEPIP